MFHDRARIHVQAGRGGDGGLSFRREKHVPKGGPDGGDGGPGGHVVLLADADLRDLSGFRPNQVVKAGSGGSGTGALKHGASGADAELRVPVGTQVFDDEERTQIIEVRFPASGRVSGAHSSIDVKSRPKDR